MRVLHRLLIGLLALLPTLAAWSAPAEARRALLDAVCGGSGQKAALAQLVQSAVGDDREWALQVIAALRGGGFVCREGQAPVLKSGEAMRDAVTLQPWSGDLAELPLVPSIVMMRQLTAASAQIDLFSPDVAVRRTAAAQVEKSYAVLDPAIVSRALAAEKDAAVRDALTQALARRGLGSESAEERQRAIDTVAAAPSETARTLLANFLEERRATLDAETIARTQAAIRHIDNWLTAGRISSILFSGLSYAGVLLITALGLSIAFGLLGVINLAHGEFIMIGAYTTYVVQRALQAWLPGWADAYVFVAIPAAFAVTGIVGMVLEWSVIRFLYRRPLETLLATWAVSLALIKGVQLVFGAQNVEFFTPSFLFGGVQVFAGLFVTWNRVLAIVMALAIFAATYALIRGTRLGLLVRATTQRRDTARSLGVATEQIDRLAFGLGTGLAGLAGVVLTQINSVNPSMGTSFVIDAFMVVVLGGAGSLVGTAVSSLVLGEINQIIEPLYGAVAAKVAVLLLIVVIIQRRPQGLFASRTRT